MNCEYIFRIILIRFIFYRKREGQYDDLEEDEYVSNENQEKLPENLMTLEEKKHKNIAEKDNKGPQPPVLGSHSESLGFKTEEEQAQEKKNVLIYFHIFYKIKFSRFFKNKTM